MNLIPLPPGVYTETFTYSNGRTETVYRAPFEHEGPAVVEERGQQVLYYMHAFYVFRWPATSPTVNVGHGSIANHMALWRDIPVTGAWCSRTLVEFGRRWVWDQLRQR